MQRGLQRGLQRAGSTGGLRRHAAGSAAAWANGLAVRCFPSKSTEQTRPGTPIGWKWRTLVSRRSEEGCIDGASFGATWRVVQAEDPL